MDYEMMVKTAYEEILGFDKEAAGYAEGVATLGQKIGDEGTLRVLDNIAASQTAREAHLDAEEKGFSQHMAKGVGEASKGIGNAMSTFGEKLKNFKPTPSQVKAGAGIAAGTIAAAAIGKGLYDRHKRKQAEKAAAYYDEAQLVKEAAEADYAEACAYEEAALAILDELGYLD